MSKRKRGGKAKALTPDQELESTAYHEAGHFVIGHAFGFHQPMVTIEPDSEKGSLGGVSPMEDPDTFIYGSDAERLERTEQEICSLYAGYAAQVRLQPGTEERAALGACSDFEKAEGWLARGVTASGDQLHERTASLVEEHWPAIERLAKALLEHRRLDDAEAEAFIEIEDDAEREAVLARYRMYFKQD